MGFVHHDYAVAGKEGILLHFLKEDSIRHYLDFGGAVCSVQKAHCVAAELILVSNFLPDEVRDAHGGYSSGLCDSYHLVFGKACVQKDQRICVVFPLPVGLSTTIT